MTLAKVLVWLVVTFKANPDMIDLPLLLDFIAAASVLAVTPGVGTAMVLRAAAVGGRRIALLAAVGIALGCLAWGAAVSLGLGALLQRSEVAYTVLKSAGTAYLLWVGGKLLLKPRQSFQSKARKRVVPWPQAAALLPEAS
ncbi:homoserine/Threonine efflux protein [compost metagenome]